MDGFKRVRDAWPVVESRAGRDLGEYIKVGLMLSTRYVELFFFFFFFFFFPSFVKSFVYANCWCSQSWLCLTYTTLLTAISNLTLRIHMANLI